MMHDKIIDLVARRFQILGDPCRLRILQALQSGAMTVSQIVEDLDGNQPNISKHLQILFDAGLVGRERSGNSIFYSIADPVSVSSLRTGMPQYCPSGSVCAQICSGEIRRRTSAADQSCLISRSELMPCPDIRYLSLDFIAAPVRVDLPVGHRCSALLG